MKGRNISEQYKDSTTNSGSLRQHLLLKLIANMLTSYFSVLAGYHFLCSTKHKIQLKPLRMRCHNVCRCLKYLLVSVKKKSEFILSGSWISGANSMASISYFHILLWTTNATPPNPNPIIWNIWGKFFQQSIQRLHTVIYFSLDQSFGASDWHCRPTLLASLHIDLIVSTVLMQHRSGNRNKEQKHHWGPESRFCKLIYILILCQWGHVLLSQNLFYILFFTKQRYCLSDWFIQCHRACYTYGPYLSQFTDWIHWVCLGPQWGVYWRVQTETPAPVSHKTSQWSWLDLWCDTLVWFDTYAAISEKNPFQYSATKGNVLLRVQPPPWIHWLYFAVRRGCDQSFCVVKWGVGMLI